MLLKLLILISLLFSSLLAKEYPLVFSQMGTPLYKASQHMKRYSDIESLRIEINKYNAEVEHVILLGFELDKSKNSTLKKEYLLALRKLQKDYDYLLHLLHTAISDSIKQNDYILFLKLTSYGFDGLLRNTNLRNRAMDFYEKNRDKGKSTALEKKIEYEKLVQSTEEFYNKVISDSISSKNKARKSKKSVAMYTEKKGKDVFVWFENKNPYDVTISIRSQYKNMIQKAGTAKIVVLKGDSKKSYTKLTINGENASYRFSYRWIVGNKNAVHNDKYIYRLPYALGTSHRVSQGFNGDFTHKGRSKYAIDFAMKIGTKIYAARDGIVVKTKSNSNKGGPSKEFARYGNYVTIAHDDGTLATYYHLMKAGVKVKIRQRVKRGELIALSGNTGYSSGPHLHLSIFSALNATSTHTIAIKLATRNGTILEPIRGKSYTAK